MHEIDFYKKRLIMILISLIAIFVLISIKSYAQENLSDVVMIQNSTNETNKTKLPTFEFKAYSLDNKLESITKDMTDGHPFGDIIAKKIYLLYKSYTSEEAISPGNPQTKTIIKKPAIFNAVKQIDKHLKKAVKKGEISVDEASINLNKVLDVALNIIIADSKTFENTLKTIKNPISKIELFVNRVVLIY